MAAGIEKRKGERVCTALPVAVGGTMGVTRDVSASGVFFEMDTLFAVGSLASYSSVYIRLRRTNPLAARA